MSRTPVIAGNWKLHCTLAEATELAAGVAAGLEPGAPEVIVAPPATALTTVKAALGGASVGLSGQTCHDQGRGAFTGENSPELLADLGCTHCILGHSERRSLFGETDEALNRKIPAVFAAGLTPILCVGETLAEREAGEAETVVTRQLDGALRGRSADELTGLIVAYEPVWAIGTGRTAEPSDAQAMHAHVRRILADRLGDSLASATRILYGGSVKPQNAAALLAEPDIDGALVGGASLDADSFLAIVRAA